MSKVEFLRELRASSSHPLSQKDEDSAWEEELRERERQEDAICAQAVQVWGRWAYASCYYSSCDRVRMIRNVCTACVFLPCSYVTPNVQT